MARPRLEIDDAKLKGLMRLKPTLEDTAAFFECSTSHIEKYVKATYGVSFSEFREQNMVHTRMMLIRKAIQMAESGNVPMLIFALKNLTDWKDKQETTINEMKPIQLKYAIKEYKEALNGKEDEAKEKDLHEEEVVSN